MKRKRSDDQDDQPASTLPPTKILATSPDAKSQPRRIVGPAMPSQATHNEEEINLSHSDDDNIGPSLPAGPSVPVHSTPHRILGPSAPPKPAKAQNDEEIPLDESDDDDIGPLLPTAPAAKPEPARRRVLGPAPPPAPLDERPPQPANAGDSDSSDSDDYGPSLPPAPGSAAAYEAEAQRARDREQAREAAKAEPAKPKRADWMLVPPSDSDWGSRVDPTKLKNRKFASGKGAKAPAEKSGISAIWTETPEEKRQRLEDEVLGRKDAATSSVARKERRPQDEEEQEMIAKRIRVYNEKNRGRSLYEEHAGKEGGGKEKEDDPSKRGFDREKDMALGGRVGHVQKRDMLKRAGDFGSRFERGKFL